MELIQLHNIIPNRKHRCLGTVRNINFLKNIRNMIEEIKEFLYPIENTDYSEAEEESIVVQAARDILLAQYIFENLLHLNL